MNSKRRDLSNGISNCCKDARDKRPKIQNMVASATNNHVTQHFKTRREDVSSEPFSSMF